MNSGIILEESLPRFGTTKQVVWNHRRSSLVQARCPSPGIKFQGLRGLPKSSPTLHRDVLEFATKKPTTHRKKTLTHSYATGSQSLVPSYIPKFSLIAFLKPQ